ncbi:MAG: hypothetical protein A2138_14020 [Deltaproteobacteria bacterium RBG_16_71_12]|nr:MAG: hypothetical protein A2138_14020 [Deltaproteobacteria bacterium RBG_16_71_12]
MHWQKVHRRVPHLGVPLQRALDLFDAAVEKLMGSRFNPLYQTGPFVVVSLLTLVVTGVYLFIFYRVSSPYETMRDIEGQLFFGRWIRAAHRYAADAAMVFTAIHALRMFVQGRTWGARALAWVSGIAMSVLLLACGWTGFILVWDVFGLQLALEGARLLDLLPFFPEPIQGQFANESSLGTGFFFVNLFLHVAIPLGLVFALWLHISRTARTTLFPPRALLLGFLAGLVVLSIAWPLPLYPEARLDREPARFGIDWLYAFWLPLMIGKSPWITAAWWAGSGALFASIPWWWRPPAPERPQASVVDERHCRGCEQCYLDCPYEAIQMIPRTVGAGSAEVARVTPDLCVSCGICSASCDVLRVGPPGRDGRSQLVAIKGLLHRAERAALGGVVVFACAQSARRLRAAVATGLTVIELECAGNLHMDAVATALKRGVAGVVVWSCPPRNCQFREGPKWLAARVLDKREAELPEGVDRARVLLLDCGPGEVEQARAAIDAFTKRLAGGSAPPAASSSRARGPVRLLTAAAMFGALGLLASTTWTRAHQGGTVRLAWRQSGGLIEQCRTPSEAEQAALPPHMRRPKLCDRRYPDERVVVRVDGRTALDRIVEAGGARKDRAPQVLFSVPVASGRHALSVAVDPVLTAEEQAATAHKPLRVEATIDVEPGAIWRVRPGGEGALVLVAPVAVHQ